MDVCTAWAPAVWDITAQTAGHAVQAGGSPLGGYSRQKGLRSRPRLRELATILQVSDRKQESVVRRNGVGGAPSAIVVEAGGEPCPKFTYGKPLREVCTWGIGGPAKLFVEVHDPLELASVLRYCRTQNLRWFVVGKGSNCLFDDRGFDGCIIHNRIDFVECGSNGVYRVGSGYAFNLLGICSARDGFSGLEFACGIPGTVGGAIFMNAGAEGQETGGVLQSVEFVTAEGDQRILTKDRGELAFGYRSSPFQKMQDVAVIVAGTFELKACTTARQWQRVYMDRRKRTQPVTARTAGCVFRNPGAGCLSAGALIDQAGLKGLSVGAARVSDIHANFLVNEGASKSQDMRALVELVKQQVHDRLGVQLQEEILYIPFQQDIVQRTFMQA